jgi:hypothetical protein
MKIDSTMYQELKLAISAKGKLDKSTTPLERWNALWVSGYPVKKLYDAGLNDSHIDTALRRIAGELS